jgi:predicted TPR repeat methyltransferase
MVTDNSTLEKVYAAKSHEDLMDAYKDWAASYDQDTVGAFGYVAHMATAKALERCLDDKDAAILDAGCGTGLVAEALKERGYRRMDGLDYSKDMLDEAKGKGLYGKYIQADLSDAIEIPDNAYDAIVCTGTFTYGHVDACAFDELIRIAKPGGVICFTIRDGAYQEYGYRKRMIELERAGSWELVDMRDEEYLRNENVSCKLCSYKAL